MKRKHVEIMYKLIEARGEVGRGPGHEITPQKLLKIIDLAMELRLLNARDPTAALARLKEAKETVLRTIAHA